jgi:hypothetical protein
MIRVESLETHPAGSPVQKYRYEPAPPVDDGLSVNWMLWPTSIVFGETLSTPIVGLVSTVKTTGELVALPPSESTTFTATEKRPVAVGVQFNLVEEEDEQPVGSPVQV